MIVWDRERWRYYDDDDDHDDDMGERERATCRKQRSKIYEKLSLSTTFTLVFILVLCTSQNIHLKYIRMRVTSCVRVRVIRGFISIQFSNKRLPQKLCLFACITKIVIVEPNSSFVPATTDDPSSRYRRLRQIFCIPNTHTQSESALCIKYFHRPIFFPSAPSHFLVQSVHKHMVTLNPTMVRFKYIHIQWSVSDWIFMHSRNVHAIDSFLNCKCREKVIKLTTGKQRIDFPFEIRYNDIANGHSTQRRIERKIVH